MEVFTFIGQILSDLYTQLENATFFYGISLATLMWIFIAIALLTFILHIIFGNKGGK